KVPQNWCGVNVFRDPPRASSACSIPQRFGQRKATFSTNVQPKYGSWICREERKRQMDTDKHRFFGRQSFAVWVSSLFCAVDSDLCSSVSICGFNCFFRLKGLG